jgi:hypothetical protein
MKVGWWTAVENGSGDGGRHFITFIFNKVIGFPLGASLEGWYMNSLSLRLNFKFIRLNNSLW